MLQRKGFTLVELVIVVLIIAALSAIAIPRISASASIAKSNACSTNVDLINSQIELYKSTTGNYPAALKDVTESVDYFPDGAPACPYSTDYTMAAATHRVAEHTHN